MTLLAHALLLLLAAAPLPAPQDSGRGEHLPTSEVLRRDPSALPRAEPGRWREWQPDAPLAAEHLERLRAGTQAYLARDYAGAAQSFWSLLEAEPDLPPALYQLGVTYFRLRRYGDCARVFERFLEVVPSQVGATQALAHCYYSLGDYEAALRHYEAVLAASPDSVEALRGQALANMRVGRLEPALELLDRCLELRPEHGEALFWKGQVLFDLGRAQEARQVAEAARELDRFDPRPWFLLSQVLYELGDDEGADEAESRFLELNLLAQKVRTLEGLLLHDPREVGLYVRLCDVHRASGNAAGVRETVARLLRAVPGELAVRSFAIDTLLRIEDRAGAQQVADGIERDFAATAEAWRVLRDYYGAVRDTVRQVRAGERYLRMGGEPDR